MLRSQNVIQHLWEGNFILFDKIPVSTIKLPQWRFQAFLDVSLFEKLIWKSRRPQDKTSIRGASPGIPYKLRNEDAIGGRGWNIATQERNICDVKQEIKKQDIKNFGQKRELYNFSFCRKRDQIYKSIQ